MDTGYFVSHHRSRLDGSDQPFALWVPRTYSARRAYPILIVLHGTDADHRMIPEECFHIPEKGFREDMLLLSPFGRGDLFFAGPGENDLWESLAWVHEHYRIDARRQYLTGLSMGGYACWRLAAEYPDQWAAIAPICGGGDPARAPALQRTPVWCVHGAEDDCVPVEESRRMISALSGMGSLETVRYSELNGWGHRSWEWLYDPARQEETLADWCLQFRKAKAPPRIEEPAFNGTLAGLFTRPLIISYATQTPIAREINLLRAEAERWAAQTFGDDIMRSGRFPVLADVELTPALLKSHHHLMIGRVENHQALAGVARRLLARHVKGQLHLGRETLLGKTLVATALQPSPWNKKHWLGVVTYQQYQQVKGIAEKFHYSPLPPLALNLYDTQQRRFIRRDPLPAPAAKRRRVFYTADRRHV